MKLKLTTVFIAWFFIPIHKTKWLLVGSYNPNQSWYIVKEPTCFKNTENPRCIDLIITLVIETGLSDFHKMTVTILKTSFAKQDPNTIIYRNNSVTTGLEKNSE